MSNTQNDTKPTDTATERTQPQPAPRWAILTRPTKIGITAIIITVIFQLLFSYLHLRLERFHIFIVSSFSSYLIITPAALGNLTLPPLGRARLFYYTGHVGIFLTLLAWFVVKVGYATADGNAKMTGEALAQMILLLGGVAGSALVIQAIRIRSDELNRR